MIAWARTLLRAPGSRASEGNSGSSISNRLGLGSKGQSSSSGGLLGAGDVGEGAPLLGAPGGGVGSTGSGGGSSAPHHHLSIAGHAGGGPEAGSLSALLKLPAGRALTGLVVHSAADGLAVGAAALSGDLGLSMAVAAAIMLHKLPVAAGLAGFLRGCGLPWGAAHQGEGAAEAGACTCDCESGCGWVCGCGLLSHQLGQLMPGLSQPGLHDMKHAACTSCAQAWWPFLRQHQSQRCCSSMCWGPSPPSPNPRCGKCFSFVMVPLGLRVVVTAAP